MSGNLMRYSGLITKTRAMDGNLLSEEQLRQLTELATVNEAVGYLKETRSYGPVCQGHEGSWHRGQAEAVIINSLYQDFEKLYRFADAGQRLAFQYVFFRYETDILKKCLKNLFQEQWEEQDVYVDPFFYKHARFPIDTLRRAANLQEFEQALTGTVYENVFGQLHHGGRDEYADFAMELDIFYYTSVYKSIKRMKQSPLKQILLNIYGTQIDWLNIMWIYRSRRFYSQTQAELAALLIPFTYRLKKSELHSLTEASDLKEMNRILTETGYFKGREAFVQMEDEISYKTIIGNMYRRMSRKYPVSIAPVLRYIYEKEQEIERLTTIVEGIRYQIPPRDIKDMILITV